MKTSNSNTFWYYLEWMRKNMIYWLACLLINGKVLMWAGGQSFETRRGLVPKRSSSLPIWSSGFQFKRNVSFLHTVLLLYCRLVFNTDTLVCSFRPLWLSWMRFWLVIRRLRVWPLPDQQHSFVEIRSWNIFYGHSLHSADSRRAVVSFWRKYVHNTG